MLYSTIDNFKYKLIEKNAHRMLVKKLIKLNLKISVAESFTGGLISKLITDTPGASNVFEYGICTYSNQAKTKILGVQKKTLEKHTAVSLEVAKEMASGIRKLYGADLAISTTGYAGSKKELMYNENVGFAFIGIYFKEKIHILKLDFKKHSASKILSRNHIRTQSAKHAFSLAVKLIG